MRQAVTTVGEVGRCGEPFRSLARVGAGDPCVVLRDGRDAREVGTGPQEFVMRSANVWRSASSQHCRRLAFATIATATGAVLALGGAAAPLTSHAAVALVANVTAQTTVSPSSANSG